MESFKLVSLVLVIQNIKWMRMRIFKPLCFLCDHFRFLSYCVLSKGGRKQFFFFSNFLFNQIQLCKLLIQSNTALCVAQDFLLPGCQILLSLRFKVESFPDGTFSCYCNVPSIMSWLLVLSQERHYDVSTTLKNRELGSINQEDYPRFDPSPSSKAAINSGPIEHGTPLMPYVPRVTPPAHPRHGSPP